MMQILCKTFNLKNYSKLSEVAGPTIIRYSDILKKIFSCSFLLIIEFATEFYKPGNFAVVVYCATYTEISYGCKFDIISNRFISIMYNSGKTDNARTIEKSLLLSKETFHLGYFLI